MPHVFGFLGEKGYSAGAGFGVDVGFDDFHVECVCGRGWLWTGEVVETEEKLKTTTLSLCSDFVWWCRNRMRRKYDVRSMNLSMFVHRVPPPRHYLCKGFQIVDSRVLKL